MAFLQHGRDFGIMWFSTEWRRVHYFSLRNKTHKHMLSSTNDSEATRTERRPIIHIAPQQRCMGTKSGNSIENGKIGRELGKGKKERKRIVADREAGRGGREIKRTKRLISTQTLSTRPELSRVWLGAKLHSMKHWR